MRIGVDIDGVLFPWDDVAARLASERFGLLYPGPSSHWHHLKDTLPPDAWRWLWTQEGSDAVFSRLWEVYPGIVGVVRELFKAGHEVHFVTHRDPRHTAVWTGAYLTYHFGRYQWAGVHIIRNSVEKHRLLRWDAFVEDKPETVLALLKEERIRVFAPARPWNTELEDELFLTRYDDPRQILEGL
jgi:hypothetical protein